MKNAIYISIMTLSLLISTAVLAAPSVHLWLTIDGNNIEGDSTIENMGRAGTIECLSFRNKVQVPAQNGQITRNIPARGLLTITKRIDRSSVSLFKGVLQGNPIQAVFRFYRAASGGSGAEEQYLTITVVGQIQKVTVASPDNYSEEGYDPAIATEVVSFAYNQITYTYEPTGATHTQSF